MKRSTKFGLALAGLTAGAAAVALKVSASTNDVPSTVLDRAEPVLEPGISGDAFLAHLSEAVRIDTTVYEDRSLNDPAAMRAFHEFLAQTYPAAHASCNVETMNDLSLLFTWEGSDPSLDPMVLMAHMDVVPVEPGTEDDWTVGAYSGAVEDGRLWGRGTLDDKGSLIAMMEAVEHLIGSGFAPQRSLHLVFGHDEEIRGVDGAKVVADTLRDRGVAPWLVADEGGGVADSLPMLADGQVALIKIAEKGYVDIEITARAPGGHSSAPMEATAVERIAGAIEALRANPVPARVEVLGPMFDALAPVMDRKLAAVLTNLNVTGPAVKRLMASDPTSDALMRTTTAVTMVSGGVKSNVLPQEAWAVVNFRIMPGDTVGSIIDHVRGVVGSDIEIAVYGDHHSDPSPFSSTSSDGWDVMVRSVQETFPGAAVAPWILTAATDSRYLMPFSGDVYGFAPFTVTPDYAGIHGTDEAVRVIDAEGAVSFFCRLIRNAQPGATA